MNLSLKEHLKKAHLKKARCLTGVLWSVLFILAAAGAGPLCVHAGEDAGQPLTLEGHAFIEKTSFAYATQVDICEYEGGYRLFDVRDSARYLQVPEGAEVPEGLPEDVILLPQRPEKVYLAATAAMALVNAADGLDRIRFSSLAADGWYVEEAAQAMENGDILFAGKYSEPDYELLLGEGCDLAVESTMILHTPKVQEKLESLGIPVFIDRSSYEEHPLGRAEWVKVYGAMLGLEEEAERFFEEQTRDLEALGTIEQTGKTVAFFYLNAAGTVVVRRSDDYVPRMIGLAGGTYVPEDVQGPADSKQSAVSLTMEEFYARAKDADFLVYNSAIDAPLRTVEDLLGKSPLFADFKAVQEENVWCADQYLYQATDIIGRLILDFHAMLTGQEESSMTFLKKIDFHSEGEVY